MNEEVEKYKKKVKFGKEKKKDDWENMTAAQKIMGIVFLLFFGGCGISICSFFFKDIKHYRFVGISNKKSIFCLKKDNLAKIITTQNAAILQAEIFKGECFIGRQEKEAILTNAISNDNTKMYLFQPIDGSGKSLYTPKRTVRLTEIWQDIFKEKRKIIHKCSSDSDCINKMEELNKK